MSVSFGSAAGIAAAAAAAFGASAAQQLYTAYPQGEGDACSPVIFGIGPHFGGTFRIYLGAFFQIGRDTGAIGPVGTFDPNRFVFLVALCILEFLCMRDVEIDDIFSIDCIGNTVLTQVADYL